MGRCCVRTAIRWAWPWLIAELAAKGRLPDSMETGGLMAYADPYRHAAEQIAKLLRGLAIFHSARRPP